MKSLFFSKTLLGVLISIIAKLAGVDGGDISGLFAKATELWPVIVGLIADAGSILTRLKATDFDKSIFASRTFWLQVLSAATTAAGAFGYDLSGLQGIIDKGLEHWPALAALAGNVISILGRIAATKKLTVTG